MTQQPENEKTQPDNVSQPDFVPPPPPPNTGGTTGGQQGSFGFSDIVKKLDPIVAKTKLDLDACRRVVSNLVGNKESESQQKRSAPGQFSPEPAKETIPPERCKKASPCGVVWESMSGTQRLRLCSKCKSFVYDLAGVDLAEAERCFPTDALGLPARLPDKTLPYFRTAAIGSDCFEGAQNLSSLDFHETQTPNR